VEIKWGGVTGGGGAGGGVSLWLLKHKDHGGLFFSQHCGHHRIT